jgi:hypothetical protein
MATGRKAQIVDALLTRAALMDSTGPTLPTALPEAEFDPPADGKYLEVGFFPNGNRWEGLANGERAQGILGVLVHWPKNLGLVAAHEKADLVAAHFNKGRELFSGTTKVTVTKEPELQQPLIDGDKVSIPVNISWQA